MCPVHELERRRLALQAHLDAQKTQAERNRLGQFATPPELARQMVAVGLEALRPAAASAERRRSPLDSLPPLRRPLSFLDPALGTGVFYSALRAALPEASIQRALGIELDPHYAEPTRALWGGRDIQVRDADFTRLRPQAGFDLVVCNPPYVRHHHIPTQDKRRLVASSSRVAGLPVSGLTGLYAHFLLRSWLWMRQGGIGVWLVPSEFMDVNYGRAIKHFLLDKVTLLRVHRADPQAPAFRDALVSSAVVVFRRQPPPPGHRVRFTYGGSLETPLQDAPLSNAALARSPKWTRFPQEPAGGLPSQETPSPTLGELFTIRRGIATGANGFFILPTQRAAELGLPGEFLTPILPPPRHLRTNHVDALANGHPDIQPRLVLVDCPLPEPELTRRHPELWAYLEGGVGSVSQRYLCRKRRPWYRQEQRPPAPILCTYMGRAPTPFRFIRNRSAAIGANVYLMLYPRSAAARDSTLLDRTWRHLNALHPHTLIREGRVYGGGLYKLEPSELGAVPLPWWPHPGLAR